MELQHMKKIIVSNNIDCSMLCPTCKGEMEEGFVQSDSFIYWIPKCEGEVVGTKGEVLFTAGGAALIRSVSMPIM